MCLTDDIFACSHCSKGPLLLHSARHIHFSQFCLVHLIFAVAPALDLVPFVLDVVELPHPVHQLVDAHQVVARADAEVRALRRIAASRVEAGEAGAFLGRDS